MDNSTRNHDSQRTYVIAETCQVPKLADLYKLFLGYKTDGVFLEVGAFDGDYVSNTSGLADIGWKGLYIEPVTEFYEKCKLRHGANKNVKVLNLAIGDEEKEIEISIGGPLSSALDHVVQKFSELDWAKDIHTGEKQKIRQRKLNDVLAEQDFPKEIDVMSLDVEGYEWFVLKDFDIGYWSPKMLIVELHDNNASYDNEWESCNLITEFLKNADYRIVYKDYSNTIFLRSDVVQDSLA